MGVPKFFRWISERYPKINQAIYCPPNPETREQYFPTHKSNGDDNDNEDSSNKDKEEMEKKIMYQNSLKNSTIPEFDRLYLDMNGIIHCCSHNNAEDIDDNTKDKISGSDANNTNTSAAAAAAAALEGGIKISEAEVFRNVCYYVDRIVTDVAKPQELVYMAIDGVAPKAKMNQQRSRRYRSGKEKEIESTFYGAHLHWQQQQRDEMNMFENEEEEEDEFDRRIVDMFPDVTLDNESKRNKSLGKNKNKDKDTSSTTNATLKEVEPGRFTGTFETSGGSNEEATFTSTPFDSDYDTFLKTIKDHPDFATTEGHVDPGVFHSNSITPGTEFFERCALHLEHFIKRKLHTDPQWQKLTVVFSNHQVPGEGEHKIMDFIRRQRRKKDYDPNKRHCLFGQDGDLVMLGLATHEPHFCLLREEVIFDKRRKKRAMLEAAIDVKKYSGDDETEEGEEEEDGDGDGTHRTNDSVSVSLASYMHNSNFELLHMSILRDYLAYDFKTRDVIPSSHFDIERTIDDFVFMTFFVGNDFLPHMPAIDIADEAFDLMFSIYKRHRYHWVKQEKKERTNSNNYYLTKQGKIISGNRLEGFLSELGRHEDPYYTNKKQEESTTNKMARKADKKAGRETHIPPDDVLAAKEEWDRANYKEMLESIDTQKSPSGVNGFKPVASSDSMFTFLYDGHKRDESGQHSLTNNSVKEPSDEGILSRMGKLLFNSLSIGKNDKTNEKTDKSSSSSLEESKTTIDDHVTDLKGRYYFDKFQFSPFDAEKHMALRKAYIEGLVWNLQYYYEGCIDWDWYYPYHYGPMLSDLVGIDDLLKEVSFNENSKPIEPFQQLMSCLPPSSAYLLPKPYQWLMVSKQSPLKEFYPDSFTVDMNGKRWPWEAAVLLPFVDTKKLLNSCDKYITDSMLTEQEKERNRLGHAQVFVHDASSGHSLAAASSRSNFEAIDGCNVRETRFDESSWRDGLNENKYASYLEDDVVITQPGFPSLKSAPIQGLYYRRIGINIFGMRSRYQTAALVLDESIPNVPSVKVLAAKFIGTTVHFRYPYLQEGFVTAISDSNVTARGKIAPRQWTEFEAKAWTQRSENLYKRYTNGEGITGSGGWVLPKSSIILSVRPVQEIQTMADGSKVKIYSKAEIEVPLFAALWSPSKPDPRFSIPSRLEKNPYKFGNDSTIPMAFTGDKQKIPGALTRNALEISPVFKKRSSTTTVTARNYSSQISSLPRSCQTNDKRLTAMRKHHLQSLARKAQSRVRTKPAAALALATAIILSGQGTNAMHLKQTFDLHQHQYNSFKKMSSNIASNWRGGYLENNSSPYDDFSYGKNELTGGSNKAPPLEFLHGTTTLSFTFDGGIVAAVDSRASIGNFVGSKTVQKVLPISKKMLGTMAGGAADCSFWIRRLQAEARAYELTENREMTVSRASRILADCLYANKGLGLSVGTMVMGYDDHGPRIFYVDNTGMRIQGDLFSVGSGSTFALGVLDNERKPNMNEDEAVALCIKAIRHATFRDAYSGGYIAVYVITSEGWKKVFSEDLALSS